MRRVVSHIMGEEGQDPENEQDDRREDGQQRDENGEVEENQTHNVSAWR